MDFKDQIRQLGERVLKLKEQVRTEEATKNAFIMPFIQSLGYDVFNPAEIVPEFTADFGIKQGEKVDYAILKEGQPTILIECKCHLGSLELHGSQLFRYFSTTSAKFGLLTNGVEYRFFTDLVEPNKMDEKPFFTFNITDIKDPQVDELKKFSKAYYDEEVISASASELKYMNELRQMIAKEISDPSPDFVVYFARKIYPTKVTQKVVDLFTSLLKRSFSQYINDLITDRLKAALAKESQDQNGDDSHVQDDDAKEGGSDIVTTDEELEAYYIVKSILRNNFDVNRLFLKDNKTYCAIILDNNTRKYLIRLHFNGTQKHFSIYNKEHKEQRHNIDSLNSIYNYDKEIIEAVNSFESVDNDYQQKAL